MSATVTTITDRRTRTLDRGFGPMDWCVTEFDDGSRYLLTVHSLAGNVGFQAHFSGEEWAEFQQLIAGRS